MKTQNKTHTNRHPKLKICNVTYIKLVTIFNESERWYISRPIDSFEFEIGVNANYGNLFLK